MVERQGPLQGVTVVDLTRALAGPHAAMMMADLGARVIKVEVPDGGDETRAWGPPFVDGSDGIGVATYFLSCNRNKESVALDLKSSEGQAMLTELLSRADVLMENFRPGTLDRLGFPPEVLAKINPGLVLLSISGFGHDGPEGGRAGYDQIAQGEAGLMSVTGSGPHDLQRVGVPIGDLLAGMYGAYGVVAALLERQRTGRGQVVRTSLLASIVGVHAFQGTRWTVAGEVPTAQGNHHPSIAPYGLFRCRGGALQVACGNEGLWQRLCTEFALDAQAAGMASNAQRVTNRELVIKTLEDAFAGLTVDDALKRLATAGVPAGRVRTLDEVYEWDQTRSQGLVVEVEHPTLGSVRLPGPPLRFFDASGAELTPHMHTSPPRLDEHGPAVRAWLREA
ncbi:CoA transferase [Ornithinimicrobium ciconiae]|uniref:CoA transferase n=1 Tax=Ornithinimicrobium ciconiae TaxID=2594265 RepID=A0A516GE84_9MICO|nr:CoA transferase [Ornithinimicrobium ciconiae]QDO89826.1 CoA transferase [Ornithinimicrobium ciconiae]